MKIDFENGLPVWVWGILFVLVVLPFSFRRAPEQNLTIQATATVTVGAEAVFEPAPIIAAPTATVDPAATESIIIEVAPAPRPAEE